MASMTANRMDNQDGYCFIAMAVFLLFFPVMQVQAAQNIYNILQNLQESLPAVWRLIIATSYVMGIGFVLKGVLMLKQYGQGTIFMSSSRNLRGPIIYLVIGISIMFSGQLIDTTLDTVWGYTMDSILSYPSTLDTQWKKLMTPITQLVQVMGLFAFMRGWVMLAKFGTYGEAQAPPGTLAKAGLHILGGIAAINFSGTVDLIYNTFMT